MSDIHRPESLQGSKAIAYKCVDSVNADKSNSIDDNQFEASPCTSYLPSSTPRARVPVIKICPKHGIPKNVYSMMPSEYPSRGLSNHKILSSMSAIRGSMIAQVLASLPFLSVSSNFQRC
jgi:hypothetical protein